MEEAALLGSGAAWGSIEDVVNAQLIDVPADASWLSVFLMWLTLPLNLIQGIVGGLCKCVFVCLSIGDCFPGSESCCSALGSVLRGRPFFMAWVWWRYMIAGLTALIANGQSRLSLFMWEWQAFGGGRNWWHGEGLWMWSYADCNKILKSLQVRRSAFGAVSACIPDLFATNILIFLSNEAGTESEWYAVRSALHTHFLNPAGPTYLERIAKLRGMLETDWPNAKPSDLADVERLQKTVCKCVFYVMFGVWIPDEDAQTLTGWRTNAMFFILPRVIQRFIFNFGIWKVKKLRVQTVGIVEKNNLQHTFVAMNDSIRPTKWKRKPVVKLCDEIMYVIGFAGIGGTSAAVESVASFLQNKIPKESAAEHIKWGQYNTPESMISAFQSDPEAYIRETLRMDPPVTSATGVLKEVTAAQLAGRDFKFNPGIFNQYVMSMANRDPTMFSEPDVFMPNRVNLDKTLTWNGAYGSPDENEYPRICPGRDMSMTVVKTIIGHILGIDGASLRPQPGPGATGWC